MSYVEIDELRENGYALLPPCDLEVAPQEWTSLDFLDWKSGGDTEFAPIASASGELECFGFWEHGKPDKGGLWTSNKPRCPTLVEWTVRVGADYGRVRVIALEPNTYDEAVRNLHLDDNNRMNPDGTGFVVRAWLQLTDDPDSFMILRRDKQDADSEVRIPLPAGAQFVVDSERMYHATYHAGPETRYALIASFESCEALERWIDETRRRASASV